MATPLTNDRMLAALRGAGIKLHEYSGWRTHNRNHKGSWGGVNGIVIHHTAGSNSLSLCRNGRAGLPGPLCHVHIAKDGTVTLLSNGRANHAGTFARNAHDAVVAESTTHPRPDSSEPIDGNSHYYGAEVENLGNGSDWYPDAQYWATVRWAAAICAAHGWSEHSVIGHKEGTRRKIDPKGPVSSAGGPDFSMNQFRRDVASVLTGNDSEDDMPLTDADVRKIWYQDFVRSPGDNPDNPTWSPISYPMDTNARVRQLQTAVAAQTAVIDKLADAIALGPGADIEALKAAIRAGIAEAVESLDISVDVTP